MKIAEIGDTVIHIDEPEKTLHVVATREDTQGSRLALVHAERVSRWVYASNLNVLRKKH